MKPSGKKKLLVIMRRKNWTGNITFNYQTSGDSIMKKIIFRLLSCTLLLITLNAKGQDVVKWKLADLRSAISDADKPTVFNFWATFCIPCLQELPYFQQLVKKYDSSGV